MYLKWYKTVFKNTVIKIYNNFTVNFISNIKLKDFMWLLLYYAFKFNYILYYF